MRGAIDIGANVEENGGGVERGGKGGCERGTIDAGQSAEDDFGGSHGGAGVAGGDETIGEAIAHQAQTDADGGIALAADGVDFVVHGDDFAGVNDFDGKARGAGVAGEIGAQTICGTDEQDAHAVVARRLQGAFDFGLRRLVGPHRIQSDYARHEGRKLGLLFDLKNFAALVVAALGAGAVRQFLLVAVGTLGEREPGERVMGAASGGALLGVSAFWIRHDDSFGSSQLQAPSSQGNRFS